MVFGTLPATLFHVCDGIKRVSTICASQHSTKCDARVVAAIDRGSVITHSRTVMVCAGAFAVTVDAQKWPELFSRVDINERTPPGYAALDVYLLRFPAAGDRSI